MKYLKSSEQFNEEFLGLKSNKEKVQKEYEKLLGEIKTKFSDDAMKTIKPDDMKTMASYINELDKIGKLNDFKSTKDGEKFIKTFRGLNTMIEINNQRNERPNKQFLNERVSYEELQDIVKDYLNKEIKFTLTDIETYVNGTIRNIDYHSNGKGFEIGIENYTSGDGVKEGTGSMSIYPNEVIFSHKDYKPHPVASNDEYTLVFFDFMKKIDFTK